MARVGVTTFRPTDSSPHGRFGPCMDMSPHVRFTPYAFRLARFALWTWGERPTLYIGWQWRNFFLSYLCQLFSRHVVGQAVQNVSYSDNTFLWDSAYTDIFLNQLIQFYSNNAINLHHLTMHSTTVLTYKMAIVLRPQVCDVISPYVFTTKQ